MPRLRSVALLLRLWLVALVALLLLLRPVALVALLLLLRSVALVALLLLLQPVALLLLLRLFALFFPLLRWWQGWHHRCRIHRFVARWAAEWTAGFRDAGG